MTTTEDTTRRPDHLGRVLAEKITVHNDVDQFRIEIDGKVFPWFTGREGVTVNVNPEGIPRVTLTIPAMRVEVVDEVGKPEDKHA